MNEITIEMDLGGLMPRTEGWGREEGREVFQRLLTFVELHSGILVFKVSFKNVNRLDISFCSETIIQLAKRFRGVKGFCLADFPNDDILENCAAAAERAEQPLVLWRNATPVVIGPQPNAGCLDAFRFALQRPYTRATEFASAKKDITITNASNKFKQLWQQGFLLRKEASAETGGLEYLYYRIG